MVGSGRTDEPRLLADLLAELPRAVDEAAVWPRLRRAVRQKQQTLVVVDDDPSGAQLAHNACILLDWDVVELADTVATRGPLVFLLTNTRGLPQPQAEWLNEQVGRQLACVSAELHIDQPSFVTVSRMDSALRGHYPADLLALERGLGGEGAFDGHLFVPAVFEAGHYTIRNVHWAASPAPTADTVLPIAQLPMWIENRSHGRWPASQVRSIPLQVVREGPSAVCRQLVEVQGGGPVIVNAATYGDLAQFTLGLLAAEEIGKRFLYRAAASFVRLRAGQPSAALVSPSAVLGRTRKGPGLVVVGSSSPASTAQLDALLGSTTLGRLQPIELEVRSSAEGHDPALGQRIEAALRAGELPVVFTSREPVVGVSAEDTAAIGRRATSALVAALGQLETRPRFVVVKGSTTSHELARRGFAARKATVLGQIVPGVPVWRLERSRDRPPRFPDIPYVVFPGDVDGPQILQHVVASLAV